MKLSLVAVGAALVLATQAYAGLTVTSSVGGAPTLNPSRNAIGGAPTGAGYENFDALPLGQSGATLASGITVSFQPDARAVKADQTNIYAAPYLSGSNGNHFGPNGKNQANGSDMTTYITAGSTDASKGAMVTLQLPTMEKYFGLLWGSVDDYNSLSFYNGSNLVGMITGVQVLNNPHGNQGMNGTTYVNINSTTAFDRVVATSTQYTFEIDNVAFAKTNPVSEPTSLALGGLGLLGIGLARRSRRA